MNVPALERGLIAVSSLLLLSTAMRWHRAQPLDAAPAPASPTRSGHASIVSDSALAEAEDLAVSNDPFRISNSPSDVRYDPASEGVSGARPQAAPPVRPAFALKAIVGGPPWSAVVDGVPGQPAGTVIRQGSQFDKLVVRSVTRDSVVIQGPDTSWVLRLGARP